MQRFQPLSLCVALSVSVHHHPFLYIYRFWRRLLHSTGVARTLCRTVSFPPPANEDGMTVLLLLLRVGDPERGNPPFLDIFACCCKQVLTSYLHKTKGYIHSSIYVRFDLPARGARVELACLPEKPFHLLGSMTIIVYSRQNCRKMAKWRNPSVSHAKLLFITTTI